MADVHTQLQADAYRTKLLYAMRSKDPATHKAYMEDCARLEAQFKMDLFETYEVSDNPKADKCYALAWEHGHSSGFSEVASYFSEFVELIK